MSNVIFVCIVVNDGNEILKAGDRFASGIKHLTFDRQVSENCRSELFTIYHATFQQVKELVDSFESDSFITVIDEGDYTNSYCRMGWVK